MRIRESACQSCVAQGTGFADPACRICFGMGRYADYSQDGRGQPLTVVKRSGRGRRSRKAVGIFVAAIGAILVTMGASAHEATIVAFGAGMIMLALGIWTGRAILAGLVDFSNSRVGHIAIWLCMAVIALLTLIPVVRG